MTGGGDCPTLGLYYVALPIAATVAPTAAPAAPAPSAPATPTAPAAAAAVPGPAAGPAARPTTGAGAGTFASPPTLGAAGVTAAVFMGGTVDQLEAASLAAQAAGVWAQDASGTFRLLVPGGPAFLNDAFKAQFPSGFAQATAVTLTR